MNAFRWICLWAALGCAAPVWSAAARLEPRIGYLYPAGGQAGTTVQILAGGQMLRGASKAYITGEGVRATAVRYVAPMRNPSREEAQEILRRLFELRREEAAPAASPKSAAPATPQDRVAALRAKAAADRAAAASKAASSAAAATPAPRATPSILETVNSLSLRELERLANEYLNFSKRQVNNQIAEAALIEITIDRNAAPGTRELRLAGSAGLSNPLRFEVGRIREVCEQETLVPPTMPGLASLAGAGLPALRTPVTLNGQIMPGDVDRFRIQARKGQKLVLEAQARRLMPYLADAVPGWFQATLALYDAKGNEVAFADDFRFDPDPVLYFEAPQDGEYEVEIRDAIYRGRADFVYRVTVGEQPFVTGIFPLGARAGAVFTPWIAGWNLAMEKCTLDAGAEGGAVRHATLSQGAWLTNPIRYAVGTLPETLEKEPNDNAEIAQPIQPTRIVNGYISAPGDIDVYRFEGKAGEEFVAETQARRLRSPLDSLLRLLDAEGNVVAFNDDFEDKGAGMLTHHADSHLSARLPRDGVFYVQVADTQGNGGPVFGYRLRMGAPQPDFELRVTPSTLNAFGRLAAPLTVFALRKDGFDGEIEVALKNAPKGFTLAGGLIPAGRDQIRVTLSAPDAALSQPVALEIEGRARIGGTMAARSAAPAEDMMQAFAYRHLAPCDSLVFAPLGRRWAPAIERADSAPLLIPAAGSAQVRLRAPRIAATQSLTFELLDPPQGIRLLRTIEMPGGMALVLKADEETAQAGYADNLIVEAFTSAQTRGGGQAQKISVGCLPAIPFTIVR